MSNFVFGLQTGSFISALLLTASALIWKSTDYLFAEVQNELSSKKQFMNKLKRKIFLLTGIASFFFHAVLSLYKYPQFNNLSQLEAFLGRYFFLGIFVFVLGACFLYILFHLYVVGCKTTDELWKEKIAGKE